MMHDNFYHAELESTISTGYLLNTGSSRRGLELGCSLPIKARISDLNLPELHCSWDFPSCGREARRTYFSDIRQRACTDKSLEALDATRFLILK